MAPLARRHTVSFALVLPSIEMPLKDFVIALVSSWCRADGAIGASVHIMRRVIAMFGCIIMVHLVIPARWYVVSDDGRVKEVERSLGKVSEVQNARAAESQ